LLTNLWLVGTIAAPTYSLLKIVALFQEAEPFTDNLAGRFIISNGHFLTDELLHLTISLMTVFIRERSMSSRAAHWLRT
jgi:hypothetical protein